MSVNYLFEMFGNGYLDYYNFLTEKFSLKNKLFFEYLAVDVNLDLRIRKTLVKFEWDSYGIIDIKCSLKLKRFLRNMGDLWYL
jgi:hypothetical protein